MNSVARVKAQVAVGYFEITVAGKITEPRVAGFWATFIIYNSHYRLYKIINTRLRQDMVYM